MTEVLVGVHLTQSVASALRLGSSQKMHNQPLDTLTLFRALQSIDPSSGWARIAISNEQALDTESISSDTWQGVRLTRHCAGALRRAKIIAEAYDFIPLPAGVLALALVWDKESSAATSVFGTTHDNLVADIQQDLLGVELADVHELLDSNLRRRPTGGAQTVPANGGELQDSVATPTIRRGVFNKPSIDKRLLYAQLLIRIPAAVVIATEAAKSGQPWSIILAIAALFVGFPITPNWIFLVPACVIAIAGSEVSAWIFMAEAGLLSLSKRNLEYAFAAATVYVGTELGAVPTVVRRLASVPRVFFWSRDSRKYLIGAIVLTLLWFALPFCSPSTLAALLTLAIPIFAYDRRLRFLIVAMTLGAIFANEDLVVVGLSLLSAFIVILVSSIRRLRIISPRKSAPVPPVSVLWFTSLLGLKLKRLDRMLHRNRIDTVIETTGLQTPGNRHPEVLVRRALALLLSGDPVTARAVANSALTTSSSQAVFDSVACIDVLAAIEVGESPNVDIVMKIYSRTAPPAELGIRLEAALAHATASIYSNQSQAGEILDSAIPHIYASKNYLLLARAMRLRAACFLENYPSLGSGLVDDALGVLASFGRFKESDARLVFGQYRVIGNEVALCQLDQAQFSLTLGQANSELAEELGLSRGVAEWMIRVGRPLDAVRALRLQAQVHEQLQEISDAVMSWTAALSLLEAVRYRMRHQTDRVMWAKQHGQVLESALNAAYQKQDWALIAELVEVARLQGTPSNEHTTPVSAGLLPVGPAPFIRVRDYSAVELSSLHAESDQPAALSIEAVAATVAGSGAWWWGTWSTPTFLYWSLVPPSGDVFAGRLELGKGTHTTSLLERMSVALPVRFAGEDNDQRKLRMQHSPFQGGPAEEEAVLSMALGALIPEPLVTELRARSSGYPLALAIAPARILANVPWPLLGIPEEMNLRLIDRASPVVTPPAAMVDHISRRPGFEDQRPAPVRLAVVNPGGDLPETHSITSVLPMGAKVLGNKRTVPPTLYDLSDDLRALPANSTALFACHAEVVAGAPSGGGLRLTARSEKNPELSGKNLEILTSEKLLQEPDRYPMPCQVLVMACDSGDIGGTLGGEWLTLGSSLLWAGADRTVVTSYPVYEFPLVDKELLILLAAGRSLREALYEIQRSFLDQWRRTGSQVAGVDPWPPVLWAAHVAFGAFGPAPTPRNDLRIGNLLDVRPSAFVLLDDAAEVAQGATLTPVHLAFAALRWAEGEEISYLKLVPALWSVGIVMFVRRCLRRFLFWWKSDRTPSVTSSALNLLAIAGRRARSAGHAHVAGEHIVYALIHNSTGMAAKLVTLITDARSLAFQRRILVAARDDPGTAWWNKPSRYLTPGQTALSHDAMANAENGTLNVPIE